MAPVQKWAVLIALARLGDKLALPVLAELAENETYPTAQLFQISAIGGP